MAHMTFHELLRDDAFLAWVIRTRLCRARMPTIVITPHRIQAHLDAILEFEDTPEMLVAVLSSVAPLASIMADVRGSYNGLVYIWVFSLLPHSEVVSLDAAMLPVVVSRQHAQDEATHLIDILFGPDLDGLLLTMESEVPTDSMLAEIGLSGVAAAWKTDRSPGAEADIPDSVHLSRLASLANIERLIEKSRLLQWGAYASALYQDFKEDLLNRRLERSLRLQERLAAYIQAIFLQWQKRVIENLLEDVRATEHKWEQSDYDAEWVVIPLGDQPQSFDAEIDVVGPSQEELAMAWDGAEQDSGEADGLLEESEEWTVIDDVD